MELNLYNGIELTVRTLVLGTCAYVGLVLLLRISGKRTLSKMNVFDFVVTIAFGSTLASILVGKGVGLVQGLAALSLLILLQFIITFLQVRSDVFQRIIKAQPSLLFYHGKFLDDVILHQRVTKEEVFAAIRQQGMSDLSKVGAVVMETEGSLSILPSEGLTAEKLRELGVDVPARVRTDS